MRINPQEEWLIPLAEGQRQAILLALAQLGYRRPGWMAMLSELAEKFEGREMFQEFLKLAPEDAAAEERQTEKAQ